MVQRYCKPETARRASTRTIAVHRVTALGIADFKPAEKGPPQQKRVLYGKRSA
jgi:hypothetical protein